LVSVAAKENRAIAQERDSDKVRFYCGTDKYQGKTVPATIVENPKQSELLTVIYFDPNNTRFGTQWTPEARCEEISKRFQAIYERDALKYITVDRAKWIPTAKVNVVCSVKDKKPLVRCEEDDLLFTLETRDDPNEVLKDLMAFRESPSTHNSLTRGKKPKTFAEGKRVYYDFANFLGNQPQKEAS
jgi:hypothetical protein